MPNTHRRRKAMSVLLVLTTAFGLSSLTSPAATAAPSTESALALALQQAANTGFYREFRGDDQLFDGQRAVEIDDAGKARLRASQQGTLIVRFLTDATQNQVVIAGGSDATADSYGAILVNGTAKINQVRLDFPQGMLANLNGPRATGSWRTFAYSVDASPGATTARTVTSIDGSTTTQFPDFASWFTSNDRIKALKYLTIGNAPKGLANTTNNVGFTGRIAFVAFVPKKYSQAEAADITGGVWHGTRAFYRGDATRSDFFRIPFLLNTKAGTVLAGTDTNFGSTGDSAENIDAAIRRKPNAVSHSPASGWDLTTIPSALHMQDYADESGYKQTSSSVIDGSIVQDTRKTGRIFLHIDLFAWNGGVFEHLNVDATGGTQGGRLRNVAFGDGFATISGRKYLLLSSQNIKGNADGKTGNINQNTDRSKFNYVADVNGPRDAAGRVQVFQLTGTPQPYSSTETPVNDSNLSLGAKTDYTLDSEFVLYKAGAKLTVTQKSTQGNGKPVPMKVFYEDSQLQVYNTSYILQLYSDDDGKTWVSDQLISGMVKRENSRYYVLGPGKAIQIQQGAHAGRLVVPVYYQGRSSTEVIFSDDNGRTWRHGEPVPSNRALHEAALVEQPDGSLRIFVRNTDSSGGKALTAVSTDGGATWREVSSVFGDNDQGVNCQISAVGIRQAGSSPGTPSATFVMTTAMSRSRVNGVAHVGRFVADGTYPDGAAKFRIEWTKQITITGSQEKFAYSSMDQLNDGRLAILFETSRTDSWTDGLQAMHYLEIPLNELN